MASNHKRNFVLSQKISNARAVSNDPKRKFNPIPQMSPEARRAMGMVQDESKENFTSPALTTTGPFTGKFDSDRDATTIDSNNNENTLQSRNVRNDDTLTRRSSSSGNRIHRLHPRNAKPPLSKGTARSRSTLSHPDPPFSTSDNTESCNQTTTASSASVYTNNNSTSHSGNINSSSSNRLGKTLTNHVVDDDYDDADDDNDDIGTFPVEQDFANGNAMLTREKSFVHALDRALERNSISRLKGDITDAARIHQPGTVRALDGGRLANAQEVVVNVCHNDQRQLVFHDDDEESLDTAKEISQIRVNIWMEYNSAFPPDNDIHDFQFPENSENVSSQKTGTLTRTSGDKSSAGSRQSGGSCGDRKPAGLRDRAGKTKSNANEKNMNNVPASSRRPKTSSVPSVPKSAMSGSSGSSRGLSQNVSYAKRVPAITRTKR